MHAWHNRFPKRRVMQSAAALAAVTLLALPVLTATAQFETGGGASTPANCQIQLSVSNPSPGNQEIPRTLQISGSATDDTSSNGNGIANVQAFVGSRDLGGTFLGSTTVSGNPGLWSMTVSFPQNLTGGQNLFVYGMSSVSGQQAFVSVPIFLEGSSNPSLVSSQAQSFCPAVMPTPAPTAQPTAVPTTAPITAPTAVPTTAVAPAATPTAAPTSAPAAAPGASPIALSISSPNAPPLTFDTTMLTAAAGAQVTVTYTNNEAGVTHNWHVFNGPDSNSGTLAATQLITGPGTMSSVTFTAPTQTGNYFFWCDVHPTIMTGTFVVQ